MILESVPHVLSLLYSVFSDGEIEHLSFEVDKEKLYVRFYYIASGSYCRVTIELVREIEQPRSFSYGFNNKIVHRLLDMENYDISFRYSNNTLRIIDPLDLSVQDFISAVRENRDPLIGKAHIVNNMYLLKKIYDACEIM